VGDWNVGESFNGSGEEEIDPDMLAKEESWKGSSRKEVVIDNGVVISTLTGLRKWKSVLLKSMFDSVLFTRLGG
jgi:hypothetical protein